MKDKNKSILLDMVQIFSLLYFVISGPLLSYNPPVIFFQVIALALIFSAVWEMRRNKFYRVPDIGRQDQLVRSGIYRYIRHPMYTSQILFTGMLVMNYFTWVRLAVFLLLSVDFLYKIAYEEKLMMKHYPDYSEYKKKSSSLIPFLY
jgi:protein-S-isoprenylcysteine O-methyltransferase Ste14